MDNKEFRRGRAGKKTKEELKKEEMECVECGSTSIITDPQRGEVTCQNCGLVIDEATVDDGPEWRAFTTDERSKRSRVGSPITPTIHDRGLSTMIGYEDRDSFGKKLSPTKRAQVYRMRKWQTRTRIQSSIERNLAQAMSELDRLSGQLGLPRNVKETASVSYRNAVEKKLVRGRSIEAMVAATVYAAARMRQVPRTLDEIARYSKINKKELGACYRLLVRELEFNIPLANPADFVRRFSSDLEMSGSTALRAVELIKLAKIGNLTAGKDPAGIAAACLYLAGITEGERRTQKEIADKAMVTEVTVRNRYKELVSKLDITIPVTP